jgi:CBS domain-containing protein
MICPTCGWDNLPGNEECSNCQQDLTPLDRPTANNVVERSLMEDSVVALAPCKPITVTADVTIRDAMRTMLTHNIGSVLVVDTEGKLVGVFSERDLLKKVAGIHADYATLLVRDFMTPNPETVAAVDTLDFALHKMDGGGYRHLPVITDGRPSGVISVRDMLRHITRLCKTSRE